MARPDVPYWRRTSVTVIDGTRNVLERNDHGGFLTLHWAREVTVQHALRSFGTATGIPMLHRVAADPSSIPIQGVADMVNKLKRMCAIPPRTYLYQLWIIGHGNRDGQDVGGDFLSLRTIETHRPKLTQLRPHFCAGAEVTLGGCRLGYATGLMRAMSDAFDGVPVRAGTANQRVIPGLEGGVRRCTSSGCTYSGRTPIDVLDDD